MASRSLGTLTLDLVAKIGGYVSGLDKADRASQKFARDQEKRFKEMSVSAIAAGTAIGDTLADGIVRAANAFPALVSAIDQFNDVSDATGASVENISALDRVARETGTTMESVEGILVKFNSALKDAKPDNDAGKLFAQLNLNIKELKSLDPAEALRRTAVAFAQFADDGNKARAMQELFGKSVREAAPFLKDLAEQNKLVGTTSRQAAEQAEIFNKQIFALKADIGDLARTLTSELIPALSRAITNFRTFKEQGNLGLIFKDAAKDILGFGKLTNDAGKDVNNFMKERERLQKNFDFAQSKGRPTESIRSEIDEINKYLQVARTRQKTLVDQTAATEDYTDAVSRRFNAEKKALKVPEKDGGGGGGGGGGRARASIDEAQRYLESLQKQLERTQELTVQEQVLQDIQLGRLGKLTEAQKAALLDVAGQIDANKQLAEQEKERHKAEQDAARVREALIQEGNAIFAETRTDIEKYTIDMERLNHLFGEGVITSETYTRKVEQLAAAFEKTQVPLEKVATEMDEFTKNAIKGTQDSIAGFLEGLATGGKQSFKEIAADFGLMLTRMAAQAAAADLAKKLFGKSGGGEGAGFLGDLIKNFSSSGAFSFASGGFTGYGAANEPAGIVHKGEYVLDAETTKRIGVGNLQSGNLGGGQTNNFYLEGQVDRRTQTQIAQKTRQTQLTAAARFR